MALTLGDLFDLKQRLRDPVRVGVLRHEIATQLELAHPNVYLSRDSYFHLRGRHRDITDFDLLLLPFAIRDGLLVQEKHKPTALVCSYVDPRTGLRFMSAIKIAANKTELWALSMYRARERQTRTLLKRSIVLQTHK